MKKISGKFPLKEKVLIHEHEGIKKDTNNRTVNDIFKLWKFGFFDFLMQQSPISIVQNSVFW